MAPESAIVIQHPSSGGNTAAPQAQDNLSRAGGPGGGGSGMDGVSKDYVDAQDEKTRMQIELASERINSSIGRLEAKIDSKFGSVENDIRDIGKELQSVPRLPSLITTTAAVGVTVLGLFLAILSYASDRFDGGISASAIVDEVMTQHDQQWQTALKEQQARDARQDQKLDQIIATIGVIAKTKE